MQPKPEDATASYDQAPEPLPAMIGRYQIAARIGAGGMGTVYKAHDPHLNRTVALKVPTINTAGQDRARRIERFQREARSAAQIWHPHVCPIYDVGEHEEQPYVVMAFVEGQSLAERLAQGGRFEDVGEAIVLILQIIDALGAVHGHGIVHRDLKPSNIMLDAGGRAVLMDFGLARPDNETERLTSDGVIVGTPAYMAPEQAAGQFERIGPWTDLYSAGVVFFEMLSGKLPFEGPPLAVLGKIMHEPPPPLSRFRPYLDPRLDAILLQALQKEPEARFRDARQFRDALVGLTGPITAATIPQTAIEAVEGGERRIHLNLPVPTKPRKSILGFFLFPISVVLFAVAGGFLLAANNPPYQNFHTFSNYATVFAFGGFTLLLFAAIPHWRRNRMLTSTNWQGETCLMRAARNGRVSVVKDLLARGAEANEKDNHGRTAFMNAARSGHSAIVKMLLLAGAEINERDFVGQTALMNAEKGGHTDIVGLLEATGARG